jgi:Cu+-exporting ATPase
LYWWGHDPSQVWPVVTAVLIVACPCALALSMPFAYGHVIRILGKKGLFLREAEVVERLSRIDTVVFDKTGTLTAREAWSVVFIGNALTPENECRVRSLARNSTHPLSAAIYNTLHAPLHEAIDVEEIAGTGIRGVVDGAAVRLGRAAFCYEDEVVAEVGQAVVHVSIAGLYVGHFRLRKQARQGMNEAVQAIATRASVHLLTGDAAVDPEVAAMFDPASIRTDRTPADKSRFVQEQQTRGAQVLMVGDGLNDAGALAQSDVGITVSESSAAFTPASDAIIDARALPALPHMLKLTRRAHRIVLASLCISLVYNITGVSLAAAGHMTPLIAAVLMPLSSVSVVGFVSLAVWWAARELNAPVVTDRTN